jgi:urease gamma subunit
VHLTPRERERLLLAAAADLARRRLARGAPLGATEAVALVCDEVCELAWDGVPLDEVIARARAVIPPAALLPGVAGLVPVIEVEALFPWGSTLVHVAAPFGQGQERGDPERVRLAPAAPHSPAGEPDDSAAGGPIPPAASGAPARRPVDPAAGGPIPPAASGAPARRPVDPAAGGPTPPAELRSPTSGPADSTAGAPAVIGSGPGISGVPGRPGAVLPGEGAIELAAGAARRAALLRNTGPRDVWISSHFPLGQVNPAVQVRWAGEAEAAPVPGNALALGTAGTGGAAAGPRRPWRLDLPAGEALLLRAGEERAVTVIVRPG